MHDYILIVMTQKSDTDRDVDASDDVGLPPRLTLDFLDFLDFLDLLTFDLVFFEGLPLFLYVDFFTDCFFLYDFLGCVRNKRIRVYN